MLSALKNQVIPLLLSLLFLAVGLGIGVVPPLFFQRDIARVERLEPLSVTELAERKVDEEVLVEGRISARTAVQENGYVAYWRERRQTRDGETKWVTDRTVTPPLVIDATGGIVRIGNDGYNLGTVRDWEDTWAYGDHRRVGGLKVGDPVVAIGVPRSNHGEPVLEASVVSRGTKASYLSDQRMWIWVMAILGGVFGLVGLVLMGFAIFEMVRGASSGEEMAGDAFYALTPANKEFLAQGIADDDFLAEEMTDDEFFADEADGDEIFDEQTEDEAVLAKDH
jgi:hypothetical protein